MDQIFRNWHPRHVPPCCSSCSMNQCEPASPRTLDSQLGSTYKDVVVLTDSVMSADPRFLIWDNPSEALIHRAYVSTARGPDQLTRIVATCAEFTVITLTSKATLSLWN